MLICKNEKINTVLGEGRKTKKKISLRSTTINLLQDRKLQRQKVDKCLMIKTEGKSESFIDSSCLFFGIYRELNK